MKTYSVKKPSFLQLLLVLFIASFLSCNSDDDTTLNNEQQSLARVGIYPVANIAGDIAYSGGVIMDDGGSAVTSKGVCWSTNNLPTIDDNNVYGGAGTADFSVTISNIEFNTTYYLRAYAENATGISYSDEISFTSTNECTQNILNDYVTLTTQTEVNDFGANNYCAINYSFIIREADGELDPIVDLTPLQNLRRVNSLEVDGTNSLTNLEGLNNMSVVEDYILISDNEVLDNIDALGNINSSLVSIQIERNNALRNIDGLLGITMLVEPEYDSTTNIIIGNNSNLVNINGLTNISIEGNRGFISIYSNELINNLDAFSGINGELEILQLINLPNLLNTDGLSQITGLSKSLSISNLPFLADLSGFRNIEYINEEFHIAFSEITNLDMFTNLNQIGNAYVINNYSLNDYCGLLNAFNNGAVGFFEATNNAYNPTRQDMLNGDCSQ